MVMTFRVREGHKHRPAKNFSAESIAFFAPTNTLLMRPPGGTHTLYTPTAKAGVFWLLETHNI